MAQIPSVLICFMGMDGSGKTTLSKYLFHELKNREYNVVYSWWLEGENTHLRRYLRDLTKMLQSSKKAFPNRIHEKKNNSWNSVFNVIYPRIVILNYIIFGFLKIGLPKFLFRDRIFIFDRYYYDTAYAIGREFRFSDEKISQIIQFFGLFIPIPDIVFSINVPPEIPLQRKKQEIQSFENAYNIWSNHQKISDIMQKNGLHIVNIDNSRTIPQVQFDVLHGALDYISMKMSSPV